jgi:hypothetical protein
LWLEVVDGQRVELVVRRLPCRRRAHRMRMLVDRLDAPDLEGDLRVDA